MLVHPITHVHAPVSDDNFRVESVQRCVAAASQVYGMLGTGDRLVAVYLPGIDGFQQELSRAQDETHGGNDA